MQNTMKTLFIIVSVMVILFIAAPNWVMAQKGKTAKLPKELVLQMARDDDRVKSVLREEGGLEFMAENFSVELIDLNRDGKPEWFIEGASAHFCSNTAGACSSWIYRETSKGKYESLIDVDFAATPKKTVTNGYKDLEIVGEPDDAISFSIIYKYDGRHYKAMECYKITWKRNKQIRRKLVKRGLCGV
jgi:hypothetical protein